MQTEAATEGYGFLERMADEWEKGINRFTNVDEALFVAYVNEHIAGIGGITNDPYEKTSLRMRRFYVRPQFRLHGVARVLCRRILEYAEQSGRNINVNAGTKVAPTFWNQMGCVEIDSQHHTHVFINPK